jgi:adenylylsulfate kinase-like enzyme
MYKIFWLTGLPCSGKTTIARELARHIHAEILDGDDIRKIIFNEDFTSEGRRKHMLSIAEFASTLSKYNNVVVALVSPLRSVREEIKKRYPNVVEIFVNADIETCKKRDVKGMYKLAMQGKIKNFTGVSAAYEAPNPMSTTTVDTTKLNVKECVNLIIKKHATAKKYSLFIGRWQPLHKGHLALFEKIRREKKQILIGVRNTGIDEKNPYSVGERIEMIKKEVPDANVVVIPDIEAICYGRKVGYEIRKIKLEENLEQISATDIRKQLKKS